MNCISTGYPLPTIRWSYTPCTNSTCDVSQKKEYSVMNYQNHIAQGKTSKFPKKIFQSLFIRNLTSTSEEHTIIFHPPEEGLVECAAKNDAGSNATTAIVIFISDADSFYIEPNGSYIITVGDNVSITCVAINPLFDIELVWYLDDQRIDGVLSGEQCMQRTYILRYLSLFNANLVSKKL